MDDFTPLGDVARHAVDAHHAPRRVQHRAAAGFDPAHGALRGDDAVFGLNFSATRCRVPGRKHALTVVGVDQIAPFGKAAAKIFYRLPKHCFRRRADVYDSV